MIKEVLATGKDVAEAKENARAALGAGELDDVKFEIVHMGSKGIFGIIGVKPAQVRAYIELPDREERRQKDRRKNREGGEGRQPRPQQKPQNKPQESAPQPEVAEAAETPAQEKPQQSKKKRHKKKSGKPQGQKTTPQAPVIPEVELKMERREVEPGEDMSFDFINTLISDIGLSATAELYSCEDGTRRINIVGEDASTLIGHHGDTLDAVQYLANLASARKNSRGERDKSRVTIDIEGYRAKREATLRALARRMAEKALRNRRSVMLEPMSAYERRIIHSEIQGIEGVSTNSIGSDNNRKIVIYLTDKKPKGIFEDEEVKTAPEAEQLVTDEEDLSASVAAVEPTTPSDAQEELETVAVETTHPDESEDIVTEDDDDGIK